MSAEHSSQDLEPWVPPDTFRECMADADRLARDLVNTIRRSGQLVIAVDEVEFLARRVHQLVGLAYDSLPPEVT